MKKISGYKQIHSFLSVLSLFSATFFGEVVYANLTCASQIAPKSEKTKELKKDYTRVYKFLGANKSQNGTTFSLWAPNAKNVEVVVEHGEKYGKHVLTKNEAQGVWTVEVKELDTADNFNYKFRIVDSHGKIQYRNDPLARFIVRNEHSGIWHSVAWDPKSYVWKTKSFVPPKKLRIMEVNPRTRVPGKPDINFRELAHHLVPIMKESSKNAVSMMPITHHNVVESWGYQPGAIFAVNYRHGTPDDLKYLVDYLHQHGIAVFFDQNVGHASKDWDTGLGGLDGTQLYFPEAAHLGEHRDWGTYIYNYARNEVKDFLISSGKFWPEEFKIDGFRVDGVTSMLYRDYSRSQGEKDLIWKEFGTNKNHDAVEFLKNLNSEVKKSFPNFITIAEESSGWPGVTKPVKDGGLGFDYMWGMGAMHHMRQFLGAAPEHRNLFELVAPDAWSEKFIYYVNSHDETAHGKRRFIEQISGASGSSKKFDVARVVTTWMYAMRGAPMLFQGDEIADVRGWNHNLDVQEHLKQFEPHRTFQKFVHDLGVLHEKEPAFGRLDEGSMKVLNVDNKNQVLTIARIGESTKDNLIIILNFGDKTILSYKIPVPNKGKWQIIFDSDAKFYGGNGIITSVNSKSSGRMNLFPDTAMINNLPEFSTLILKVTQ